MRSAVNNVCDTEDECPADIRKKQTYLGVLFYTEDIGFSAGFFVG